MEIEFENFKEGDGEIFSNWVEDKDIQFQWGVKYKNREDSNTYPLRIKHLVVLCKAIWYDEKLIGMITLTNPEQYDIGKGYGYGLGYIIDKEYWNKGIATAAVNKLINMVKSGTLKTDNDEVNIIAWTLSTNIGSIRVLEKNNFEQICTKINDDESKWFAYELTIFKIK